MPPLVRLFLVLACGVSLTGCIAFETPGNQYNLGGAQGYMVQRGTHYVEFMPIGSHHTWYGLLYVKGLAGIISLVIPALWCFFEMLMLAQVSQLGRLGLRSIFIMLDYSNGENLEILAYLFWPALLILGAAHQEAAAHAPRPLPAAALTVMA
jgi:hypothetical protein